MKELVKELQRYLDSMVITDRNIGDVRRSCFVPWNIKWNGIVRDETAKREIQAEGEDFTNEHI
jgi:hypothetical protein